MTSISSKILAWSVHIFTASGLLAVFMAIIAIDQEHWREAFLWLVLCFVIDSVDGTLARKFKVSEVLPGMDGKSIDYVIDFASYSLVPAFFFYKAKMVADEYMLIALSAILLSSALYYGKKKMVEDEQYFIGFPVLWNFVVFYQFFIFQNNQTLNLITVFIFAILHFVPIRFAYPSMTRKYFWLHFTFSIIGISGTLLVLYYYPIRFPWMEIGALIGASYFSVFAIFDTAKR